MFLHWIKKLLLSLLVVYLILEMPFPLSIKAAVDKSGVSPSVISLPTGPGSIEGLGPSFEPQLNSGTAVYTVSIKVPPGINGLQPRLGLVYNSGQGNSPFGLGWSLDIPFIQRQTDKGIPQYNYKDVFIYQGEEMVPMPDPLYGRTYSLKNESSFVRIIQIGEHWEVTDRSGTVYRFGMYPDGATPSRNSRVGKSGTDFSRIFKWYLDETEDTNGNKIEYYYTGFADSTGQLFPSRICYNRHGNASHEILFFYENRLDPFSDYLPGFRICTGKRCTQIEINTCGSLVRRYVLSYEKDKNDLIDQTASQGITLGFSLLYKITQYDNTPLLTEANYLPPMCFDYTFFDPNHGMVRDISNPPPYSLGLANTQIIDINGDGLPDIINTSPYEGHLYYLNKGNDSFSEGEQFSAYPPVTLSDPGVQLADFDGDGLCDLIQKAGGENGLFQYFPNLNSFDRVDDFDIKWGDENAYDRPYPPMDDSHVRMLDLDFDKKTDFMKVTQAGIQYYFNRGKGWQETDFYLFGDSMLVDMGAEVQFIDGDGQSSPYVHLADMNGDRLQDMVKFTLMGNQLEVCYWPNMGRGQWDHRRFMGEGMEIPTREIRNLFLFDVNRDGLSDLVAVDNGILYFWINIGTTWSQGFTVYNTPVYIRGKTVVRQADMNGNGSTDLVWENLDNPKDSRLQYFDFIGEIKPQLLCLIDNGLGGETRISYSTSTKYYIDAREKGNPWQTKLPNPLPLVSRIVRTCGLDLDQDTDHRIDQYVTDILYRDGFYDAVEKEFRGFSFVKEIRWGDETAPTQVTRYAFHTGAPDRIDNDGDGATDERSTDGEWEEESLKGKLFWTEKTGLTNDPDGCHADNSGVFERVINDWKVKVIHTPDSGNPVFPDAHTLNQQSIVFACLKGEDREIIEANKSLHLQDSVRYPSWPPKIIRTTYEYDYLGNQIEKCELGEVQPGNSADDERFTYTDHALNFQAWIIDRPCRIRVTDESGHIVSEKRFYYDGEDFTGLGYGQIGERGNMKREEQVVTGNDPVPPIEEYSILPGDPRLPPGYAIQAVRNAHDQFGNIIAILDPKGNRREIEYDQIFHTFPVKETIYLESDESPLIFEATYDYAFGVIISSRDFNGYTTCYTYDGFGRITRIVKPGDSYLYPTQQFHYKLADPLRWRFYDYNEEGCLILSYSTTNQIASSVISMAREEFGKLGTINTIQYTDGMGRKLATVEEGDEEGSFVVKDAITYNQIGEQRDEYLPYFTDTDQFQIARTSLPKSSVFYDSLGRVIRTLSPPDALGKLHSKEIIYLPLERHEYDEEDTDQDSPHFWTPTIYINDGLGHQLEVKEILHNADFSGYTTYTTRSTWDLLDKLIKVVDNQDNVTLFRYDCLGRRIFMNDPDRGRMYYTYDENGNLIETKDNKGQILRFSYDAVNRIRTENFIEDTDNTDNNVEVAYYYDYPSPDHTEAENLKGFISYIVDQSGIEYNSYDKRGNVIWTVKKIILDGKEKEFMTSQFYDALDRVREYVYPDGQSILYNYNARSLIKNIPGFVPYITYTPSGFISTIGYANSVQSEHDYDPRQRITHLLSKKGGADPIQDISYRFDGVNNILEIKDGRHHGSGLSLSPPSSDGDQRFSYDDLYRLITAEGIGYGKIQYLYDSIGNMIYKSSPMKGAEGHVDNALINLGTISCGGTAGTFSRAGRNVGEPPGPHAITRANSGLVYEYDDNGNMLKANENRYFFDYKDRLVSVKKGGTESTYLYDYSCERIIKKVKEVSGTNKTDAKTTLYVNKNYEIRNGETIHYIFAGNRRVAQSIRKDGEGLETQTIHLFPGWNLISSYLTPLDSAIDKVCLPISTKVKEIWAYNALAGKYQRYIPNGPASENSLNTIEPFKGYLVLMAEDAYLTISGTKVQRGILLYSGWNLIGAPSQYSEDITSAFSSIEGKYYSVWGYNAGEQCWKTYFPEGAAPYFINDMKQIEPGCGYWVEVKDNCILLLTEELSDNETFFYHPDHLGSSNIIIDRTGSVIESTEFYPFGMIRYEEREGFQSSYKFTGKELDEESGLMYFGARYYDPVVGRFASVDPLYVEVNGVGQEEWGRLLGSPQKGNMYSYVCNNPLKWVDPLGLSEEESDSVNNIVKENLANWLDPLTLFSGKGIYLSNLNISFDAGIVLGICADISLSTSGIGLSFGGGLIAGIKFSVKGGLPDIGNTSSGFVYKDKIGLSPPGFKLDLKISSDGISVSTIKLEMFKIGAVIVGPRVVYQTKIPFNKAVTETLNNGVGLTSSSLRDSIIKNTPYATTNAKKMSGLGFIESLSNFSAELLQEKQNNNINMQGYSSMLSSQ